MAENIFQNPLFVDIETVSCVPEYNDLSEGLQAAWKKKASYMGATTDEEVAKCFDEKAGIFAEFGKVVVIAVGYIRRGGNTLHIKGLADQDEVKLLQAFSELIEQFPQKDLQLCGHNSKEFDFPYLCRRMVVHGLPLPNALDVSGKKPWEVSHIDTMELWKFGDRKSYTSLDTLAQIFGIASSKDLMDGSHVQSTYYDKKDLDSIRTYCMKDVAVTAQVYRRLRGLAAIPEASVHLQAN